MLPDTLPDFKVKLMQRTRPGLYWLPQGTLTPVLTVRAFPVDRWRNRLKQDKEHYGYRPEGWEDQLHLVLNHLPCLMSLYDLFGLVHQPEKVELCGRAMWRELLLFTPRESHSLLTLRMTLKTSQRERKLCVRGGSSEERGRTSTGVSKAEQGFRAAWLWSSLQRRAKQTFHPTLR